MTWELSDHACGHCFGRVLAAEDAHRSDDARWRYRCAECGHSGVGSVASMCCCGTIIGGKPGLECVRNPAPTKEFAQEVLVRRLREEKKQSVPQAPARVEINDLR